MLTGSTASRLHRLRVARQKCKFVILGVVFYEVKEVVIVVEVHSFGDNDFGQLR